MSVSIIRLIRVAISGCVVFSVHSLQDENKINEMGHKVDSSLVASLNTLVAMIPVLLVALFHMIFGRPRKEIKNDIVLVTGSALGLGRELAIKFAKRGCEVICVDLQPEANMETVKMIQSLGGRARAYICNVADRQAVIQLEKTVGRVDILVNNAGIYPIRSLWNVSEEDVRTIIDVNLCAHFWLIQAFVSGMKERDHGHVVGVSSMSALLGLPYSIPYAASKSGVQGLMDSLDQELRLDESKVKVSTVYPFFINTRPEIEECLQISQSAVSTKYVAAVIIRGILENRESFTVPMIYSFLANITRFFPRQCYAIYLKCFNFNLIPPKFDQFEVLMKNETFKKTGTLKEQCCTKD